MAAVNTDLVASASIKGGRLFIRNRRDFDRAISQFRDGAEVEIGVTIRRATRSPALNRYYWGVVVHLISEHTGYTPDEVHEFLKMKFIPKRLAVCKGNGEIVDEFVLGGSTRKMTNAEFQEYVAPIKQWSAEDLGVYIPDPNEAVL